MSAPRKYPDELRERSVRLVRESGRPIAHIAEDLGVHREALRQWVRQAEAGHGEHTDMLTSNEREELKRLLPSPRRGQAPARNPASKKPGVHHRVNHAFILNHEESGQIAAVDKTEVAVPCAHPAADHVIGEALHATAPTDIDQATVFVARSGEHPNARHRLQIEQFEHRCIRGSQDSREADRFRYGGAQIDVHESDHTESACRRHWPGFFTSKG